MTTRIHREQRRAGKTVMIFDLHPHHRARLAQARHHLRQQPPTSRPRPQPTVRDALIHQLSERRS